MTPDESFIRAAWWWPDAWDALQQRKAHCIVSVMSADDPRSGYAMLARLTAAVIDANPNAIGVIWDAADAVWQADTFRNEVDGVGDGLPLAMCVSVKLGRDTQFPKSDGSPALLAMTFGLAAFGLMEIEVRGFEGEERDLIPLLLNIAGYLIENGPVIADGDTLGPDEGTRFRVQHLASTLAPGTTVYRVHFGG